MLDLASKSNISSLRYSKSDVERINLTVFLLNLKLVYVCRKMGIGCLMEKS